MRILLWVLLLKYFMGFSYLPYVIHTPTIWSSIISLTYSDRCKIIKHLIMVFLPYWNTLLPLVVSKKVKESCNRLGVAQSVPEVLASQIFMTFGT